MLISYDAEEVISNNATDLSSAITLVNEIKSKYNELQKGYNELIFKLREGESFDNK